MLISPHRMKAEKSITPITQFLPLASAVQELTQLLQFDMIDGVKSLITHSFFLL